MDAFSSENAEESSGGKPNFVGRIELSDPHGEEHAMKEKFMDDNKDYYEFLYEIEVLDHDWKNQLQYGVEISNNFASKWMVFIGHMENIHGKIVDNGIEDLDDLAEVLEGKVYEFRELTWEEDEEFTWEESPNEKTLNISEMFADSENAPNEFIVPVRELDEDELDDIEVEGEEEDVEEIEL